MKKKFLPILFSCLMPFTAFAGSGIGTVQVETVGYPAGAGKSLVFFYTTSHDSPPTCNSYSGF